MPRKKLTVIPGRESAKIDCFAFRVTNSGKPVCQALKDTYCIKEEESCSFRLTVAQAAAARERAHRRLIMLGYR